MKALIGRKLGMTQIFGEDGTAIPVTVIAAGPCAVVRVEETGDRGVVQLGFGRKKAKHSTKAEVGHARAAGLEEAPAVLQEFTVATGDDRAPELGDTVTVAIFTPGDRVKVTGRVKGRGFQGVVRRHGFRGGPATHGSTRYRGPGSMGPGTDPSRVIKGKKLPGQMGGTRRTEVGLRVVRVDEEQHLLFVRGAVPGPTQGIVTIREQEGRGRYA